MILQRIAIHMLACMVHAQPGAKALFLDATSGVSVQSSSRAAQPQVAQKAPPSTSGGVPVAVAAKDSDVTGLRYWLELQTEQGQLLRVTASRTFKSGERIRLHLESNVNGQLTILQSQDGGSFSRLFPNGRSTGKVEKFRDQAFPSASGWFRFDAKPGDIRLMVMVQADDAAAAKQSVQMASNAVPPTSSGALSDDEQRQLEARMRAKVESLRGSKALLVEDDSAAAELSTYVVSDPAKAPGMEKGMVAVELKLTHR